MQRSIIITGFQPFIACASHSLMAQEITDNHTCEWTLTLCLNQNHNISFPIKIVISLSNENVITNWKKVTKDIGQKCVNKFRKHGISKKKLVIFSHKGSNLTEIENKSVTLDLRTLENDHFIFDGCKLYVSKKGDSISFIPESDIKKVKKEKSQKQKEMEQIGTDLLMIQMLPSKASMLQAIIIGKKGQKIRDIIGTCKIEAAIICQDTNINASEKKKRKYKNFFPLNTWNSNFTIIQTIDSQTIILQRGAVSGASVGINNNNSGINNSNISLPPLKHAAKLGNMPFILLRGSQDGLIKAKGMLNDVIEYFFRATGTANVRNLPKHEYHFMTDGNNVKSNQDGKNDTDDDNKDNTLDNNHDQGDSFRFDM